MDHGNLKLGYINISPQGGKEELYLGSEIVFISRIVDDPLVISCKCRSANGTGEYKDSGHTSVQLELDQQCPSIQIT